MIVREFKKKKTSLDAIDKLKYCRETRLVEMMKVRIKKEVEEVDILPTILKIEVTVIRLGCFERMVSCCRAQEAPEPAKGNKFSWLGQDFER